MEKLIDFQNVGKIFNQGKLKLKALDDVCISIESGEFIVLQGASGSGKSTLLNIAGGILNPTSGKAYILGKNFYSLSDRKQSQLRKQSIGFVFQQFYLIPNLTVFENIELPLKLLGFKDISNKVNTILEYLGLDKFKGLKPAQISGGQQQRVALARAIVKSPNFLIADEPTASLDSKNGNIILEMLKKINKESGKAIILTSHDSDIIQKLNPDRIIKMQDGILC